VLCIRGDELIILDGNQPDPEVIHVPRRGDNQADVLQFVSAVRDEMSGKRKPKRGADPAECDD